MGDISCPLIKGKNYKWPAKDSTHSSYCIEFHHKTGLFPQLLFLQGLTGKSGIILLIINILNQVK